MVADLLRHGAISKTARLMRGPGRFQPLDLVFTATIIMQRRAQAFHIYTSPVDHAYGPHNANMCSTGQATWLDRAA